MQVALQQIARGVQIAPGSVIEYVVCESRDAEPAATTTTTLLDGDGVAAAAAPAVGSVGKSIAERARHPSAVLAADGALSIDREWCAAPSP